MTATREKIWTVEQYHRMIEAGILNEDDNIMLKFKIPALKNGIYKRTVLMQF